MYNVENQRIFIIYLTTVQRNQYGCYHSYSGLRPFEHRCPFYTINIKIEPKNNIQYFDHKLQMNG